MMKNMFEKYSNEDFENAKFFGRLFWRGIFATIAIMFAFVLIMYFLNWDMAKRGQFGDMFAVVNTFFSGIGFFLLFYTLIIQMLQIKSQQKQINDSKKEQIKQNENAEKQQFETAFFNLLQLQNEIVKNIDIKRSTAKTLSDLISEKEIEKEVIYGKDCFKFFYNSFVKAYKRDHDRKNDPTLELIEINDIYIKYYTQYQNDLGHYFRTLYHLVKFVHLSNLKDKKRYTSIIRAQLSSHELLMLFYNCLSDLGNEKFKPLVLKYHFLKNISISELIKPTHKGLYDKSAYGE